MIHSCGDKVISINSKTPRDKRYESCDSLISHSKISRLYFQIELDYWRSNLPTIYIQFLYRSRVVNVNIRVLKSCSN